MAKEICISSTPHETRLAILEDDLLTEIYYERENEYTLAGSIYKGRVTRVLPGMQSAFVDLGLERDAFLYVTDFMEEQEDSADFEKISNGNGGGRRETPGARESQAPREARAPRTGISVEAEPRATDGGEGREAGGGDAESAQGTRRWRGRRGRRRGGKPQGPRATTDPNQEPTYTQSSQGGSAIEQEFAVEPVRLSEPGIAGADRSFLHEPAPAKSGAPSQPIVLPGESLSRYGGKPAELAPRNEGRSAAPASMAASVSSYRPTTLVEVVPGWDGGAELPGESLSRHRGKSAAPVVDPIPAAPEIVEHAWEVPQSSVESASEEHSAQLTAVPEEHIPVIGEYPAEIEPETAPEHSAHAAAAEVTEELAVDTAVRAHHEEIAATEVHAGGESHFEPETASASYRVDTAAPSEYRVSSVLEPEVVKPVAEHNTEHGAPVIEEHVHHGADETASVAEEITAITYEDEVKPAVSVDSSPEAADPLLEVSTQSTASTVVEELPHSSETEFFDDGEDDVGGPQGFAPGAGTIEEEIIEEEEYDSEPIHAYADEHDIDDLEEETLDNLAGAELSEMVRDAHLEQRIGASPDDVAEDEESDVEYGEAESDLDEEDGEEETGAEQTAVSSPAPARRDGRNDDGRHGGRGPRRRGRPNGGGGGGSRRANSQLSDLPIISELLKQGQEILVQIAKEPIAKKGARITSHIALPGRFLVFMPTVNHVGVSRKISSDDERQRLKRILISEKGAASGGFIVRTAADGASEDDLRADIRFLIGLWNDIKQRADDGKAPALIYHDLNLIERVMRDQVSANFATIWVDNEAEYERIVRFLSRFEPSLVRRVKLYTKETPLFEQFGIQEEIGKALKSKVWLKSGGSIVINQTEALVAIDINTGKYVGKTARLEDTILKTNLDAIPEIVRQIRLRDLGGIIVIDFIDMDERKNRHKVMAALEEELKTDRAPSKVLQFNDFGLVAITRKRVKQSLERTLSVQCEVCAGTGMVKSPTTVCNEIYIELRKMQRNLERGDVLLRVHPEVVKALKAGNAKWLNELEEMTGKTIIVKSDPALHPEQFDIH